MSEWHAAILAVEQDGDDAQAEDGAAVAVGADGALGRAVAPGATCRCHVKLAPQQTRMSASGRRLRCTLTYWAASRARQIAVYMPDASALRVTRVHHLPQLSLGMSMGVQQAAVLEVDVACCSERDILCQVTLLDEAEERAPKATTQAAARPPDVLISSGATVRLVIVSNEGACPAMEGGHRRQLLHSLPNTMFVAPSALWQQLCLTYTFVSQHNLSADPASAAFCDGSNGACAEEETAEEDAAGRSSNTMPPQWEGEAPAAPPPCWCIPLQQLTDVRLRPRANIDDVEGDAEGGSARAALTCQLFLHRASGGDDGSGGSADSVRHDVLPGSGALAVATVGERYRATMAVSGACSAVTAAEATLCTLLLRAAREESSDATGASGDNNHGVLFDGNPCLELRPGSLGIRAQLQEEDEADVEEAAGAPGSRPARRVEGVQSCEVLFTEPGSFLLHAELGGEASVLGAPGELLPGAHVRLEVRPLHVLCVP